MPIFIEGKGYDTYIRNLLPHNDKVWDEQLETIFKQFIDKLVENIVRYNYSILFESQFPKLMKKKIDTQKKKRSNKDKRKGESKERIEQKLRFLYHKELERIRQINKLYEIEISKTEVNIQYSEYSGKKQQILLCIGC